MKRVQLTSGLLSTLFGVGLLAVLPDAATTIRCLARGTLSTGCLGGESPTAAVGVVIAVAFVIGGVATAGYALYTV
jgi:hypothetical protein